jgi:ubiquitin carboxyl-terminal hydrolase 5/13
MKFSFPGKPAFVPNEDAVAMISSMGFTRTQAIKALKATDNNVERAADWIFSHQDELDTPETEAAGSVAAQAPAEPQYRDGEGSKYFHFTQSHLFFVGTKN